METALHMIQQPIFEPWMIADLKKSGICPVAAYALGFRPIKSSQYASILGFTGAGAGNGMIIPFRNPTTGSPMKTPAGNDFIRVKLEQPVMIGDSKAKYLSPKNGGQHAYILREAHDAILGGAQVILTEGEKKSIAVTFAGMPTVGLTGNWGWIGEDKHLLPELQLYVKPGSDWLVVWDSDATDNASFTASAKDLAGELGKHKCHLKVCVLPKPDASVGKVGKTGIDDYILHPDGGIQKLKEHIVKKARRVFHENYPPTEADLLTEIKSLGLYHDTDDLEIMLRWCGKITTTMDKIARACFRKKLHEALDDMQVKSVAKLLDAALIQEQTESNLSGRAVQMKEPEPWPDAVDGQSLADNVKAILDKYLVLPPYAADAITLWVFHAHAHDAFEVSPILALLSAVRRCGKSTTLSIQEALVPRPLMTANQTQASLFRLVDRDKPTLLIDEADTFMEDADMAGMINAGHRKQGAFVHRVEGDNHEVRQYSVWGPKVIARIGDLSDTNQDRSIVINLKRKEPHERVERWRIKYLKEYEPVKQQLQRWSLDTNCILESADPQVPGELDDRAADNWRPLLAIADTLGGDWPTRARDAAIHLSADRAEDNQSYCIQLLGDIEAIFVTFGEDRIQSQNLLEKLKAIEERPWGDYRNGKPITPRQMADLLRPFGIRSQDIRFVDGTKKGYAKSDFNDAFMRYLPSRAATGATLLKYKDLQQDLSATKNASREVSATTQVIDNKTDSMQVAAVSDQNTPTVDNILIATGISPESGNSLEWGEK